MADDQLTLPLSDEDLMRMARYRYDQSGRVGADFSDFVQLRDIFPSLLDRMAELVERQNKRVRVPFFDLRDPDDVKRMLKHAGVEQ
ncbi:hypothetical protein [Novosphingobium guangzhouense]|nr:hypothetical protein [Novosphingobium guangzhouense]